MNGKRVDYFKGESRFHVKGEISLTFVGKTAIRTLLGPLYAKVKKGPKLADEEEAKALLSKILPK